MGRARRPAVVLAACAALVAAAPALGDEERSEYEREQDLRLWRELDVPPPPVPNDANLVEFFVSAASDFRFFVDRKSVSVTKDGVVRYVLVAISPSGARNISYEGIRCTTGTYRVFASGRLDGSWSPRGGDWQRIRNNAVARWHDALRAEYFCPFDQAVPDAATALQALERGGLDDANRARRY